MKIVYFDVIIEKFCAPCNFAGNHDTHLWVKLLLHAIRKFNNWYHCSSGRRALYKYTPSHTSREKGFLPIIILSDRIEFYLSLSLSLSPVLSSRYIVAFENDVRGTFIGLMAGGTSIVAEYKTVCELEMPNQDWVDHKNWAIFNELKFYPL